MTRRTQRILGVGLLVWVGGGVTVLVGGEETAAAIDGILTRLEKRGEGLKDIHCAVRFTEEDRINLTTMVKHGSLKMLMTETNPRFLFAFERTESDGIAGRREWYLFDGRYLHEGMERLQQVTRHEIARPGETINLFDLESSPFPMPFGQKKEMILKHFEVALVPPAAGSPKNTDHLRCVPRPDSSFYTRYDTIDFFIDRELHLPLKIVITRSKGLEVQTAEFPDLSPRVLNQGLTEKDFSHPREWRGYKVVNEESGGNG